MAENKEGQEKTEDASAKRLDEARDRGQVAKSQDVTVVSVLLIGGLGVYFMGGHIVNGIQDYMTYILHNAPSIEITDQNAVSKITDMVWELFKILVPVVLIAFVATAIGEISQVKLKWASKKFTEGLNWKQIFNPFTGMKRMFFSGKSFVELIKSFLKLIILGLITWSVLDKNTEETLTILEKPYQAIGTFLVEVSLELLIKVVFAFAVLAGADFFYQRYRFSEDMKMTKQESKEETKQMMGDPKVKARFRSLMLGRIRSLMMKNMKTADVVITNPTHFAVALKYDQGQSTAPIVIAKGADFMAQRIREQAAEYNIPIVENPPLARTLFFNVDVNQEIPESLFKTIAEILAYVYGLKSKRRISM